MAKLEEYKRKRRFDRTPEPSGEPEPAAGKVQEKPSPAAKPAAAGRRTRLPKPKLPQLEVRPGAEHGDTFVVQKHRATRLHYDFSPGPCPRDLRRATPTSGWPFTSKIIHWTTATSKGKSQKAIMERER